jgi:DNA-binding MarR family transcriptional regulator
VVSSRKSTRQTSKPDALASTAEYSTIYSRVESILGKPNKPLLGLHLHAANVRNLEHFHARVGLGEITVTMISILCVLYHTPGLSQSDLARLIKVERMTAGVHVERCVARGLVSREKVPGDRRRYALALTAKGRKTLHGVRRRVPDHEGRLAKRLTAREHRQLITLLDKVGHD